MKKSTLIMILSLVLAVAIGVGSTMAYLQDTDEDVNVMTLGNVYIEQHEYERAVDEEGNYEIIRAEERGEDSYKLKDFTQAKPLYPATGEVTGWDEMGVCFEQLDGNKLGKMTVLDGLNNVQDKFVFVENTGKSDAYVRTIIAYEVGSAEDAYGDLIMTSTNTFWLENEIGVVTIDDNNYYVVEYLYDGNQYPEGEKETIVNGNGKHPDGIVHPGEYTYNSLAQIYLKGKATNEDMEAIDGNKNGTYDILVVSQAVQTQGFADAKTALDTAFGPITVDNNPWKKGGEDIEGTPVFPDLNAPVIPETNWLDDGKADTTWYDAAATEYELSTAAELAGFAKLVNEGTNFNGKTVKLAADIDLKDNCWTPIGQTGTSYGAVGYFAGNFDGQGHTIKNLFIQETNDGEHYAVGLFGFLDAAAKGKTIGNFTIDGANIKGHHWVGAAVGYLTGTLENVTVKNAVISSTHANDDACGDKTGAVVGYINGTEGKMINCSAIDSTVTSGRDAGQVVGSAMASQVVDCTATNVTVTATGDCTGANVRNEVIGRLN